MPASTILLIDADVASAESISTVLTGVGYTVTISTDPDEAFGKVADHQLVIIDVIEGKRTSVDICREIRATPALSSIPVLCIGQSDDVEERIRFLEAGADDVIGAFAVAVDRVRQPASAPRGDLHDLAFTRDDLAGGAVDDRLGLVVSDVGSQDEHEFIAAHAPGHSFQWGSSR